MERGSKLAIKKIKKVEPKDGEPFYAMTLMENVYNPQKPFANKWETVFYEGYVFDTSVEFECADFSLDENKQKYHFDNIANKDKSMLRVLDFKFEHRTVWDGDEQVFVDGLPKYKPVFYITKYDLGLTKYVSEETKTKNLEQKISKLEGKLDEVRAKYRAKEHEYNKLNRKFKERGQDLRSTKKELKKSTEPQVVKQREYKENSNITFDDM